MSDIIIKFALQTALKV